MRPLQTYPITVSPILAREWTGEMTVLDDTMDAPAYPPMEYDIDEGESQ